MFIFEIMSTATKTSHIGRKISRIRELRGMKQEALAEKLVVEHGVQNASKQEIEQEFDSLDAVESDMDDIDENDEEQTDMDCVSGSFADLFDTIES